MDQNHDIKRIQHRLQCNILLIDITRCQDLS
jgi:hypothetical protein